MIDNDVFEINGMIAERVPTTSKNCTGCHLQQRQQICDLVRCTRLVDGGKKVISYNIKIKNNEL